MKEKTLTKKELIDYLQKNIELKLNKNQRHGMTLWVLLVAIGVVLSQLPDAMDVLSQKEKCLIFFVGFINFIFSVWNYFDSINNTNNTTIILKERSIKKFLQLLFVQGIIVGLLMALNMKVFFILKDVDGTRALLYAGFFLIYIINIAIIIYYSYVSFNKNSELEKLEQEWIQPQPIWIKSTTSKRCILLKCVCLFVSGTEFFLMLIGNDIIFIKFSLLVGILIWLIINCVSQYCDKSDENYIINKYNEIVFSENDIFKLEHEIKSFLEIQSLYSWIIYVSELLHIREKEFDELISKISLHSKAYDALNSLYLEDQFCKKCNDYTVFMKDIICKKELFEKDFCANKYDKEILLLLNNFILANIKKMLGYAQKTNFKVKELKDFSNEYLERIK